MANNLSLNVAAIVLGATASSAMATNAVAYVAEWSVTGGYEEIVATDCRDCEEDLGIIIACTGNGQPAKITLNAAAAQRGTNGAFAPVSFSIDGQLFTYTAETVEFGMIGFTPVFSVAYDDPLIPALQAGRNVVVSFNGEQSTIGLKGSRNALEIFKAHCGWTPEGFRQNLARKAPQGRETQPPQHDDLLPVSGNTVQPQPEQAQGMQPMQPGAPQFVQLPPTQSQTDQPLPSQGMQPETQSQQSQIFGVAAGEAHTPPNQHGELWFTSSFDPGNGTGATRELRYGIPETDAAAMVAVCNAGTVKAYPVTLLVGAGEVVPNGQQMVVELAFDGQVTQRPGRAFSHSAESAGVELRLPPDDPIWGQLAIAHSVSFGIQGRDRTTVPGAGKAASFFHAQCAHSFQGK